jgi:hypothetical protein
MATAVEGAFVERVLELGGRLNGLWDAVVKGTASAEEQRLSWLLAPAGARLSLFLMRKRDRGQEPLSVINACPAIHTHLMPHHPCT